MAVFRSWRFQVRWFAGYVINTAGLEDLASRSQISGWLQAEYFENSIWKSAEVIPVRIFQWFLDSLRLFRFDKMNSSLFTCLIYRWLIIASKWYSISFFKSGMLLQQLIALLEGVSVHFSSVYCTILKCQFDENWPNFFPHFFAQYSQLNRKKFFDVNKIEYNHSSGGKKLP